MKKPCYVLATLINGEWFYIHKDEHYDWDDTFNPSNSIWFATRFDTAAKAKACLKKIQNGTNYFERAIFATHPAIEKDAWKVYEMELAPLMTEVK